MNYRFLAKKALDKFFDDTELSVGEIMRLITQEKYTGLKAENRGVLMEMSDEKWYENIEKTLENETETEYYNEQK